MTDHRRVESTASLRIELFPADLDAIIDFYTRVLCFDLVRDERDEPSPYAAVQRGRILVGLAARPDAPVAQAERRPPRGVEIVIEVADVAGERDHVAARWPIEEDLIARPWGLRDFRVLDPAGYYLRVTELPDAAPAG